MCAKSGTDASALILDKPINDGAKSSRAMLWRDAGGPTFAKSGAKAASPVQAELCAIANGPKCARSATNSEKTEPVRINPTAANPTPMCAELRVGTEGSTAARSGMGGASPAWARLRRAVEGPRSVGSGGGATDAVREGARGGGQEPGKAVSGAGGGGPGRPTFEVGGAGPVQAELRASRGGPEWKRSDTDGELPEHVSPLADTAEPK